MSSPRGERAGAKRAWPQVKSFTSPGELRERLAELDVELPVDDVVTPAPHGVLSTPVPGWSTPDGRAIGNRFCVLPMEGWDATRSGRPTDLVRRRWERFGAGGAKLIWGGEAVAVRPDGRANPNQLCIGEHSEDDLAGLRSALVAAHVEQHGTADDLVVGLQLTHSGRWARPDGRPAPRTAAPHPVLDARVGLDGADDPDAQLSDEDLDALVGDFVRAAQVAQRAGFSFVDVKACHGYLGHELLGAVGREGKYGGSLEHRARFHLEVVRAVRERCDDLAVGVRLSAFDLAPYRPGGDGVGVAEVGELEPGRFGGRAPWTTGEGGVLGAVDLTEPLTLIGWLVEAGMSLLCVSAGSPYYNPHIQRPAYFPPSDGYLPPEDPLVGVARMQLATREIAAAHPGLVVVGSGLSYLQDWFGNVAQPLVEEGWMGVAGLGRMVLSYPDLPADLVHGRALDRRKICRTFSDCTTAPRNGLVSGCYPLDDFYKSRPERIELAAVKRAARRTGVDTR